MNTAKIFWSGRAQAVRLPREFRFEGEEVHIRRQGRAVILEAMAQDWAWLKHVVAPVDEDFERAVFEPVWDRPPPSLDDSGVTQIRVEDWEI